jgi:hypothetical protein
MKATAPKKNRIEIADPKASDPGSEWKLRLYVAGQTPKSLTAFEI